MPMQQSESPRKVLILRGFLFFDHAMKSIKKHLFGGLNGGPK
jgi:hypothetical protein